MFDLNYVDCVVIDIIDKFDGVLIICCKYLIYWIVWCWYNCEVVIYLREWCDAYEIIWSWWCM